MEEKNTPRRPRRNTDEQPKAAKKCCQLPGKISVPFPGGDVFHKKPCIQVVKGSCFFHKLKTLWRTCKSPALTPLFRVDFHTFHRVFHKPFSTRGKPLVHFVIFKSEL